MSKSVAEALREWLPCVIQMLQPFVSSEDIHKGDVWFGEVSGKLNRESTHKLTHKSYLDFAKRTRTILETKKPL